jgi:eukaryotic-like serine/threonine-protein kinase
MVADDGAVKVLDFGLARARDATALTQSATVLGTAGYLAPEQALGKRADERSDIYSLGGVLYALLTGRPPFTGESAAAILNQHVNSRPRPPSALNRRVPPAVDAIVLQMLSKSPAARPQSATEVRERLSEALTQDTAPTKRMDGATRGPPTASTRVLAAGAHRDRSRRTAAAVALAAAALLVLLIVALASGGGAPSHRISNTAASKPAATRPRAASPSTPHATAARAPAAQAVAPAPTTVAGALGALSSLLAQDAQAGTIDPQAARQLSQGLARILTAYDSANARDAEKGLAELSNNLTQLQNQGRITPAAAGPLDSALARLSGALPQNAPQAGRQDGGELPGQGALPPGQAKKQGDRGSGGATDSGGLQGNQYR